jgi:hypothetical protein
VYGLAGDEAAAGAAQEAHHGGDFFRFTPASQTKSCTGSDQRNALIQKSENVKQAPGKGLDLRFSGQI